MRTKTSRAPALAATSLGFGVVQLDVSVVNVAIEPIRADLGGTVGDIQWVVSAYTVVFAALILSAGALGDRIGAKRVFVAGFAVFTAASVGCGVAPSLGVLIGCRVVQGIGAAVLVPCSLSVLSHAYPEPAERARAVGLWAAGASVGLSGGPVLGGVLTAALSWRWVFLINLPLGLLGIALTLRYASETTRSPERSFDLPGQLLGVGTLAILAGAMTAGGARGFADPFVLGGLLLAVVAGAVFVVVEARRRSAMLPLALFGSRTFSSAAAIGLVINIAFYGLIFVLSLYFQSVRHYSPLATGLAFAPATGVVLLANVLAGRLTARFGTQAVIASAAALMAVSLGGLLIADESTPYPELLVQLLALGFALGVIVPAMTAALLGSVELNRSGVASGTLNTARQTGSVIGVALFGSFAAANLVAGLHLALGVLMALAIATIALAVGSGSGRADRKPVGSGLKGSRSGRDVDHDLAGRPATGHGTALRAAVAPSST